VYDRRIRSAWRAAMNAYACAHVTASEHGMAHSGDRSRMDKQIELVDVDLIREQIHDFLTINFLFGGHVRLDDNASLLEQGVLDSTGVLELVLFVEETYGISVDEADLLPENFDTINSVTAFVATHVE
jgi:acyl carrier protein